MGHVFPARAGMSPEGRHREDPGHGFPRIRGDEPASILSIRAISEFSPHTRDEPSTNDFYWLTNDGLECVLKSTRAKYKSIKAHIQGAVLGARDNHGVIKDVFVIDLGTHKVSDKLRQQLAQYNQRVQDGKMRRLFVMSSDGAQLEEILLF